MHPRLWKRFQIKLLRGKILEALNPYGRRRHVMCGFWPSVSMRFFGGVEICKRRVLEVLMRFDKNSFRSYVSSQLRITPWRARNLW